MSTRERILTIRLLDKLSKHPMYAKALGVEISAGTDDLNRSDTGSSRKP